MSLAVPGRVRFAESVAAIQSIEVLTGIGLTLLGCMLPALSAFWALNDSRSGSLLLAVFAGSALGALLVRAPFHLSLVYGLALTGGSMAALALSHGRGAFVLLLIFGTGLGLTMTSNSLLVGQRFPRRRAAMLSVLNFSWSGGAAVCPFAVQLLLHRSGVPGVFWAVAMAAAAGMVLAWRLGQSAEVAPDAPATGDARSPVRIVVFFALFTMLYCGAEAALGGWVLTYVHRLGFGATAVPPFATSCFWFSLLVGRALAPAVLLRISEERLLGLALVGAFAGVGALLTLRAMPAVLLSAALAGFSMAPIFPICVSIFITVARDAAQARWLFAVAGLGSASLPWATGIAAQRAGSLHVGLLVPFAALGIMLVMLRWPGGGYALFRRMFPRRDILAA